MASEKDVLDEVVERFPESCRLITKLYHSSDFFRSLCEDYYECMQVIKNLEASDRMIQKRYDKEYRILLKDLEKELRVRLMTKHD